MSEEEVQSVREMIRMQLQKVQERGVDLYVDNRPASRTKWPANVCRSKRSTCPIMF